MLDRLFPKLFCQLERIFGRQRAGHVVLAVHRKQRELG
jgi:hypothetical protein